MNGINETICFFTDLDKTLARLTNEDAGALIKAIFATANGREVELEAGSVADALFPMVQDQVDRLTEYRKSKSKRGKTEQDGANRSKQEQTGANRSKQEQTPTPYPYPTPYPVSPNGDIKEKAPTGPKRKAEQFVPPTVDDVRDYCEEKGIDIDPEVFVTFYASKGWMVGKNKMKNWRQAVSGWAVRERERRPPNRDSPKPGGYEEQLKGVDYTKLLYKSGG